MGPIAPATKSRAPFLCGNFVCNLAGKLGGAEVDITYPIFESVIGLCDGGTREGIGLNNISASLKKGAMDILNKFRAGDAEKVVVSLEIARCISKALIAEVRFFQRILLDHCAHCPVQEDNAFLQQARELLSFSTERFGE